MAHDGMTPQLDRADSESGYEKKMDHDLAPEYQDAFGNEEGAEVKYKTMKWWQTGMCEYIHLSQCPHNDSNKMD